MYHSCKICWRYQELGQLSQLFFGKHVFEQMERILQNNRVRAHDLTRESVPGVSARSPKTSSSPWQRWAKGRSRAISRNKMREYETVPYLGQQE